MFAQCMGVEQLLLTEDGEPAALWNPETQQIEQADFEYEEADEDCEGAEEAA